MKNVIRSGLEVMVAFLRFWKQVVVEMIGVGNELKRCFEEIVEGGKDTPPTGKLGFAY